MGWTNEEEFLCVLDDGLVVMHNMFGKYLHTFSISQKVQDSKVVDARIFTSPQNFTGIAVMTANYKMFLVNNIQEPKMRRFSELPSKNYNQYSQNFNSTNFYLNVGINFTIIFANSRVIIFQCLFYHFRIECTSNLLDNCF